MKRKHCVTSFSKRQEVNIFFSRPLDGQKNIAITFLCVFRREGAVKPIVSVHLYKQTINVTSVCSKTNFYSVSKKMLLDNGGHSWPRFLGKYGP